MQIENETPADVVRNPVQLKEKITGLISVISMSDDAPTDQTYEVFKELKKQIKTCE